MPTTNGKIYLGSVLVSGGGDPTPAEWVRPADWLPITEIDASEQKFIGLMAITDDDSNFAALSASGAYTVDWGDGTTTDHATGTTALKLYDYSAISNDTLSERGYKQVIVTVTPQAGQNLTALNLNVKHTQSGLQAYETGWLDIEVGSPNFSASGLVIGGAETVRRRMVERVRIANFGSQTTCAGLFQNCTSLQSVPLFNTAAVTNMSNMFNGCFSLQSVPLFNTSAVANMANMFQNCPSLQSVPLFNTAAVTNMNFTFNGCSSLQSVPLFNTAAVTSMNSMFFVCPSLQSVPLFNTSAVTSMASMFQNCTSLQSVPLFNTSAVANMNIMFSGCSTLQSVPLFNTAAVTSMANMFQNCFSLQSVPLFNTAAVTSMANMFQNCTSLQSVPAFDVSAVSSSANFTNIFNACSSLSKMQATGFNFTFSLASCKLSGPQLDAIYTALPTVTGQTITVTGNWGTASHTPSIATAKGWTVTV
jgi:surface protein